MLKQERDKLLTERWKNSIKHKIQVIYIYTESLQVCWVDRTAIQSQKAENKEV